MSTDSPTSGFGAGLARADLLAREDDVNGVPGRGVGVVEEEVDAGGTSVDEAGTFERGLRIVEALSTDHDVNILRVAHGGTVNGGDPCGDRVAARDGVLDSGILQGCCRTQESLTNEFHGVHHPLQKVIGACGSGCLLVEHDGLYEMSHRSCVCPVFLTWGGAGAG
jgi:hypothetical protein